MNGLVILLRLIHIISGVFWVGGGLVFFFFIGPTLGATAEAGQKFVQHLMTQTRFTAVVTVSAILTVLAGATLYWIDSDGLSSAWMHSGAGLGFGIGAFFALIDPVTLPVLLVFPCPLSLLQPLPAGWIPGEFLAGLCHQHPRQDQAQVVQVWLRFLSAGLQLLRVSTAVLPGRCSGH